MDEKREQHIYLVREQRDRQGHRQKNMQLPVDCSLYLQHYLLSSKSCQIEKLKTSLWIKISKSKNTVKSKPTLIHFPSMHHPHTNLSFNHLSSKTYHACLQIVQPLSLQDLSWCPFRNLLLWNFQIHRPLLHQGATSPHQVVCLREERKQGRGDVERRDEIT